jgi:L-lactate dehydrogenase complex protein LldF
MTNISKAAQFQHDAEAKAFDREHRRKIRFNIGKYDAAVSAGMQFYKRHELARDRGAYLKATVLEKLDEYLLQFEAAFTARGGRVIWARDAAEALAEIGKLTKARNAKNVVKANSMTTEEIHLNKYLDTQGVE